MVQVQNMGVQNTFPDTGEAVQIIDNLTQKQNKEPASGSSSQSSPDLKCPEK